MKTLWKPHSIVKKWTAEFKTERERALRMIGGLAALKMPPLMKMSRPCTPWLCVIGGSDPVHSRLGPSRSLPSEVSIRFWTVQSILTDILGMSKVSARWVPLMLTNDQKRTWLNISRYTYLLSRYEDDPSNFMDRVVTQNETCVHHFDPKSKIQSKQCSSPPKKFKRVHSAGKVMASIFLDSQGMIMIN